MRIDDFLDKLNFASFYPTKDSEWSKTLEQIQVEISPLLTQVQIQLRTLQKQELILNKVMLHVNIISRMVLYDRKK